MSGHYTDVKGFVVAAAVRQSFIRIIDCALKSSNVLLVSLSTHGELYKHPLVNYALTCNTIVQVHITSLDHLLYSLGVCMLFIHTFPLNGL